MRPKATSRRRFLRGIGGALFALPLLDMPRRRGSRIAFPRRFIVFFHPNGTVPAAFDPTPSGPNGDFDLSYILEPLAAHKKDLLILQGLDMESSYHGPGDASHWNGMAHMLTGTELLELSPGFYLGGGQSIDQAIAAHFAEETHFPSLELTVGCYLTGVAARLSYLAPGLPLPPLADPREVYARLFSEISPETRARRETVLDAVRDDLHTLEQRVGAEDRKKLHAHNEAVRNVERRLTALSLEHPSCSVPTAPPMLNPFGTDEYPTLGRLQMDLAVVALACDLTRVITLQWQNAGGETRFPWLGLSDTHHALSHQMPAPAATQAMADIHRWYMGELSYLLDKLRQVPEGDGTLLDHTAILVCSEIADGPTHSRRDLRWLLAGKCGGALSPGRVLKYQGSPAGHTHTKLLISLAQAMGLDIDTFGNPAYGKGPLEGLLA